jgi:epoxyqueuosine reductase
LPDEKKLPIGEKSDTDEFSKIVVDYAKLEGSLPAGIAAIEFLAGGTPSIDLSYVLPGTKSAVVSTYYGYI